jgi:hypothetical protein
VSIRVTSVPDSDTHGQIVLGVLGTSAPIEMKWPSPHNLVLSCSSCEPERVNFETVKSGDVLITYDDNLRFR